MTAYDASKKAVLTVVKLLKLDSEILEKGGEGLDTLTEAFEDVESDIKSFPFSTFPKKPPEGSHRGIYYQYFVDFVGVLLRFSGKVLENEQKEVQACSWSSEEMKSVSCLVHFYVKFGVLPHLQKGVAKKCVSVADSGYGCFSPKTQLLMLFNNLMYLFTICKECKALRNLFVESSLNSVLGGYMQLCFSPKTAKVLEDSKRRDCMQTLNTIIESWITKDRFVEEILILQGNLSDHIVPKWLREKCGLSLTRILLEENGIKIIVISMVSKLIRDEPGDCSSWEKIVALSTILSTIPSTGVSVKRYCALACPQLLELLVSARKEPSEVSQDIVKTTVTTIHALHEKFPEESKVFEEFICKSLSCCCCDDSGRSKLNWNQITDKNLCDTIENLHQICVAVGVAPDSLISLLVGPYSKLLFLLLCDVQDSSTHLKTLSTQLLVALIKSIGKKDAAETVMHFFSSNTTKILVKNPIKNLKFSTSEDYGIVPIVENSASPAEVLHKLDTKVKVLTDIILISKVKGLPGEVLLLLLENLCKPEKNIPLQTDDASSILMPEDRAIIALLSNEERFITFGLLNSLCETVDPNTLLSDVSQILSFIKVTLDGLDIGASDSQESLKMCISILGICLMSELDSEQRQELDDIASVLDKISSRNELNAGAKELISDLLIAIRTFGAVNETSFATFSKAMRDELKKFGALKEENDTSETSKNKRKVMVEEIGSTSTPLETQNALSDSMQTPKNNVKLKKSLESSFNEALEEVFDPSPAIKGGSIRYLTNCIEQKLPAAIKTLDNLSEIFLENLEHEESFVFLSAVQGLVVITSSGINEGLSKKLFDKILSKFTSSEVEDLKTQTEIESRMKFGEILTRLIRDFGDMASHHAAVLLPEFLKGARHRNPDMRASCLSNFAELAPMALYFLPKIQQEIKDCLCGLSTSDPDQLVRRSAVYAIYQLVNKLGEDIMRVLGDVIKELYRTLKALYEKDGDEKLRLHAQLALEELDKMMRSAIFKPTTLSKTIRIDR